MGGAATGYRAMTTSSSPGISLMAEGMSYIAMGELPCVIVNVMRAGPGLGGILPAQGDYFQATRNAGHGDYRMIVLAPDNLQEAVDLIQDGFDLSQKYRTPVMVLADGLLWSFFILIRKHGLSCCIWNGCATGNILFWPVRTR